MLLFGIWTDGECSVGTGGECSVVLLYKMPYTHEAKILIKHYRQHYGYGATRIKKVLPDRPWTINGLRTILKKVDTENSIARKPGSGRPRTARTHENIEEVEERILSQEEPGTHETPAEIAFTMDISKSSIRRIVKKDLGLTPLKRIKGQKLKEVDE